MGWSQIRSWRNHSSELFAASQRIAHLDACSITACLQTRHTFRHAIQDSLTIVESKVQSLGGSRDGEMMGEVETTGIEEGLPSI